MITPRSVPSASIAATAPSRRSESLPSTDSSGGAASERTREAAARVGREDVRRRLEERPVGDRVGCAPLDQAEEARGGVDDGEPGPAVAQEELVERPLDVASSGIATGSASITSATVIPSMRPANSVCTMAPRADCAEDQADQRRARRRRRGRRQEDISTPIAKNR